MTPNVEIRDAAMNRVLPHSFLRCQRITLVPWRPMFHEPNPERPKLNQSHIKIARDGLKLIAPEVRKWKDEMLTKFRCDSVRWSEHGDYEVVWKFDSANALDRWQCSSDHDNGVGRSNSELMLGPNKTAIFRGCIDTTVPKDGITKYMGYCSIQSGKNMRSFMREEPFDWTQYTHLLLRVRGDGRPYQVILGIQRFFDIQWNDVYSYPLYTRGGPYWQLTAIPFCKFLLAAKGRIQDKQAPIDLQKVISLGITLSDGYSGPFNLEIDFVGVYLDATHNTAFDYELYEVKPYMLY